MQHIEFQTEPNGAAVSAAMLCTLTRAVADVSDQQTDLRGNRAQGGIDTGPTFPALAQRWPG
jgi:hypothetical protein